MKDEFCPLFHRYRLIFSLLILGLSIAGQPACSLAAVHDQRNDCQSGFQSSVIRSHVKPLYLNIIWHQHQPLYLDPASDQLQGPWVRTHGTKDYYDMVALVQRYPDVHMTVNLTSSLMVQLEEYYV